MAKNKKPVGKELRALAVEKLRAGVPVEEIADEYGVTRQRVGQWKKELEAEALKAGEGARAAAGAGQTNLNPASPAAPGGGGHAAAARAAGLTDPNPPEAKGQGAGEKKPDPQPEDAPEPIDGATVVEDVTDLMALIFETYAMFQDADLNDAVTSATTYTPAEKRRLLNYAQHWVPYWKKFGASGIGKWLGLGIFLATTSRKFRMLEREIERQDRERKAEAFRNKTAPGAGEIKTAQFEVKK